MKNVAQDHGPHPETPVAAFVAAFPEAARVFLRRGMHCVGCPMASFDTLAVAASAYGVPWEVFVRELVAITGGSPFPGGGQGKPKP